LRRDRTRCSTDTRAFARAAEYTLPGGRLNGALSEARTLALLSKITSGTANMDDQETRRKIIREWMALPKDKRETAEQAAAFATKAVQQNKFHSSRRDPDQKFRRGPFEQVIAWLAPRSGKS
jgi:hypothetical protein